MIQWGSITYTAKECRPKYLRTKTTLDLSNSCINEYAQNLTIYSILYKIDWSLNYFLFVIIIYLNLNANLIINLLMT